MRLRAVRPFRWAGEHVEPGTLLDVAAEGSNAPRGALTVSVREAHLLVHGHKDCVYVDDGEQSHAVGGMVIGNADPVVEHRDPSAAPKGRRPR